MGNVGCVVVLKDELVRHSFCRLSKVQYLHKAKETDSKRVMGGKRFWYTWYKSTI